MKLGIIGCGFVGGAVAQGFSLHADLKIYDKAKAFDSLEETINQDILFLCLPTPMRRNGEQNLDIMDEVISGINDLAEETKIIVIKSTVVPGTTRKYAEKYPKHQFVMNPEFLTARSARLDFINSSRIVIGAERVTSLSGHAVAALYRKRFPSTPIFPTTWEGAELIKYMANCFFALKITYMNEIYDVCQSLGLDYDQLKAMFVADGRIGNSHLDVPGFDGDRGFGGTCFPKDTSAFALWARRNGTPVKTVELAFEYNKQIRKKIDWEETD